MREYQHKHVKRDPETGSVARRTIQPEEHPSPFVQSHAWEALTDIGAIHMSTAQVDGWDDLYTPPEKDAPK